MKYFETLPKDFYNLSNNNSLNVVTNITSRFQINEQIKTNSSSFYQYIISDGETPEIIADKIYKDSNRHWIILMMNDIVDPQFDWPLNDNSLNKLIEVKYTELANGNTVLNWTKTNIKSYYRSETRTNTVTRDSKTEVIVIDQQAYSNIVPEQTIVTTQNGQTIQINVDKATLTYYDYEVQLNEKKRSIKLLKPEYIEVVEQEMKGLYA